MHYYQFNIGDYIKSTLHLTAMEDLAYRRLLDRYYDTEKPLDCDIDKLCRFIRMSDHKKETQQILEEFFSLTQKGWIQKRVQKELGAYSAKAATARDNGKKGGRPKITQPVIAGNPEVTQAKAKQETLNIKQEPLTKEIKTIDHSANDREFDHVWDMYGKKGNKKTSASKFSKISKTNKQKLIAAIPNYIISTPDKQFRKNLETYINQECWNDEVITYETYKPNNYQPRKSLAERTADDARDIWAMCEADENNYSAVGQDGSVVSEQMGIDRGENDYKK